jgi:hypothetical protein
MSKKDFSKLDAVIAMGEADVATRPLTLVPAAPPAASPPPAAVAGALPQRAPEGATGTDLATPASETEAAIGPPKRPITVRLTEEVVHALMRHQAAERCKPGVRLGESTIGSVIDALLRGPLGLPPVNS